jgi:methionyl-tRNA formyltransferase
VAEVALRAGVPLLRPASAADPGFASELAAAAPDLGVVVAFGQFLPKRVRELPRLGYLVNAHASLLPKLRGAAPIARAILAGERETGISVMRVEREMDAGAVALVRRTPIGPDETAGELGGRLAALAAEAIAEAVERASEGTLAWTPQDSAAATTAPKFERADCTLDFREPAEALVRRVRALAPEPGAATELDGEPLRVLAARARPGPAGAPPGTVRVEGGALRIATGDGWLEPLVLQRAGRRALPAADFLRGRPIADGARLGAARA